MTEIRSATCIDGPWAGLRYTHITKKPIGDRFNVVGADGARVGSYTCGLADDYRSVWRWGPWIDEPKTGEPK